MAGLEVRASQFQSLNPLFIILLAPLFAMLWPLLARRGWEPGAPAKFGLGHRAGGLGVRRAGLWRFAGRERTSWWAAGWLALAYLLHTTGELCLSPVGLSMVTKLSVARVAGLDDGRLVFVGVRLPLCGRLDCRWRKR